MLEGMLIDDAATARAHLSVDIRIEGPDALAVGRALAWSSHPLYIFDVPLDILARLQSRPSSMSVCR